MAEAPLAFRDLVGGGWRELAFGPFRPGVEMHRLYGGGASEPAAALLRYAPGAAVPLHEHPGYEHVLVLDGEQEDEQGRYGAGAFIINPPGSRHRVRSAIGCVVLLIWEKPVVMLEPG